MPRSRAAKRFDSWTVPKRRWACWEYPTSPFVSIKLVARGPQGTEPATLILPSDLHLSRLRRENRAWASQRTKSGERRPAARRRQKAEVPEASRNQADYRGRDTCTSPSAECFAKNCANGLMSMSMLARSSAARYTTRSSTRIKTQIQKGLVLWGEAGAHAARQEPELQRFYRRKLVQKGLGKASVAVARKLGIRLWIMLRDQIEYHEFCRRGQKQQKSSDACAGMPETRYGAKSHRPVD
jgi:hypothetical protein